MPAKVYYDSDVKPDALRGKKIAVIGYGSQGHAHALNLRDSGLDVRVGLRRGKSWDTAENDRLKVLPVADAVHEADISMILVNDEFQAAVYQESIKDNLRPGNAIGFGHGFNIHFGQIVPPKDVDVLIVHPTGP